MTGLPYVYEAELTNACPFTCRMCPRGRGDMKRPVGFMSQETFEQVARCIPDAQKILRLHHFGEPLLHPQLPLFISMTRSRGLLPVISVNPASFNEDLIDRVLDSGVGIVCFSVDSLKSARLHSIRGIRKSAEYCMEMLDVFIRKSRTARHPVLKVIQMVALTENMDERQEFLDLKNKYPEDDVYVYISGNFGFGDFGIVQETDAPEAAEPGPEGSYCNAPFDDIVVLWNGDVVLCCYDYDGFNVIGNINDDPIDLIWNNKKIRSIREAFEKHDTAGLGGCGNCFLAPHNFTHQRKIVKRGYEDESQILKLFPLFRDLTA